MTISFNNTIRGIIPEKTKKKITLSDTGYQIPIEWSCSIPYTVSTDVVYPSVVSEAIDYVNLTTNYTLVPRTNEQNYVEFRNGEGCNATLGKGDSQIKELFQPVVYINISRYCDKFAIVHEIGHLIGLSHTLQRQDRDNYISMNNDNIMSGFQDQYQKNDILSIGDFDWDSTMLYDKYAFSKNKQPVFSNKQKVQNKIGSRVGYSIGDIKNINNKANDKNCPQKSKPPVCHDTDIVFNDGDEINSWIGANGIYFQSGTKSYTGYNIYDNERFVIGYNESKGIWEISHNNAIYAYSNESNLFGKTGWNVLDTDNTSHFVKNAMITKRDCTWPDLSKYHINVPFDFRTFFDTNNFTIILVSVILLVLLLLYVFRDNIKSLFTSSVPPVFNFLGRSKSLPMNQMRMSNIKFPRFNSI